MISCLSKKARSRERVRQVTNPAIDPYRESLVMSIEVYLGRQGRHQGTGGAQRFQQNFANFG